MKFVPQARYGPSATPLMACPDSPIILMIDRDRRLLDCTPSGASLLSRGEWLACEFGRVAACRRHDEIGLERLIEAAAASGSAALTLGEGALRIEIARLGGQADDVRLLLICRQEAADKTHHVEEAAHLFGLTTAEHRLLRLLFDGMSLARAAASLGVARTTARTHLQRIFDKVGCRRQSDLVRLVALGSFLDPLPVRPVAHRPYGAPSAPLLICA